MKIVLSNENELLLESSKYIQQMKATYFLSIKKYLVLNNYVGLPFLKPASNYLKLNWSNFLSGIRTHNLLIVSFRPNHLTTQHNCLLHNCYQSCQMTFAMLTN